MPFAKTSNAGSSEAVLTVSLLSFPQILQTPVQISFLGRMLCRNDILLQYVYFTDLQSLSEHALPR